MTADPGAVRAARALRNGHLQAVQDRDLEALIENVAGWMSTDLDVRAVILAEESTRFEHGEGGMTRLPVPGPPRPTPQDPKKETPNG